MEEAKRWGIAVRLPSVNHSHMEYTAEASGTAATKYAEAKSRQTGMSVPPLLAEGERALRIGLMQVRGLRVETIVAIVRARDEGGAFRSLEDFLRRVPVERDEIEALIKCGALDEVGDAARDSSGEPANGAARGISRPEMLWRWNFLQAGSKSAQILRGKNAQPLQSRGAQPGVAVLHRGSETLFADAGGDDEIGEALAGMPAAEYTLEQRLRYEREILEVCVSGHPLDFLPRNGEAWSDELDGLRGKRVTLCGWVVTYRHVGTKNYRNMMFVTLEDQRGLYEVVLFPDAYDRYGGLVFETRAMRVTGRVEIGGQINGEKMEALKK